MHHLTAFALAMFLSTGLGSALVQATAAVLGLNKQTTAEQPPPPGSPEDPSTHSGASWDPNGQPGG